jgi:hypothetical protein
LVAALVTHGVSTAAVRKIRSFFMEDKWQVVAQFYQ